MALDLDKLKSGITDAMLVVKKDNLPDSDLAEMMATAIVDYASDAEITIAIPLIQTVPPVPPAGVLGTPDLSTAAAKLSPAAADAGKGALQGAILASLKAMDIAFAIATTGIVAYTATLAAWTDSATITAAGAAVIAVPPIFVPALAIGMAGGETEDVGSAMATIIHASFLATIFTGPGLNTAPPSAGPIVSTLL